MSKQGALTGGYLEDRTSRLLTHSVCKSVEGQVSGRREPPPTSRHHPGQRDAACGPERVKSKRLTVAPHRLPVCVASSQLQQVEAARVAATETATKHDADVNRLAALVNHKSSERHKLQDVSRPHA